MENEKGIGEFYLQGVVGVESEESLTSKARSVGQLVSLLLMGGGKNGESPRDSREKGGNHKVHNCHSSH
ncbi:hypothetical protein Mapa_004005 [Marchantia paleacea]|nr:hypothetical protein Mapa_004005 [Marchantia paleacea]